jgi:hypothetical protein
MPVTLNIKGDDKKFPTPMKAIATVLNGLNKPDSGVDALALGHATCVATAQAVRTNPPAGLRAMKTLHRMTEAFRDGDIEKGIRLAVVLGIDSLVLNSKAAGVKHPDTSPHFEKAYKAWADVAVAPPSSEPPPGPEAPEQAQAPEVEGDVVTDAELAGLDDMFDDDDNDDDWADD